MITLDLPTAPAPGRKMNLPVGSIVVRCRNGKPARFVKVRDHGPKQCRWMLYARYWWIRNRGPVPAGKRVAHLDGDQMNDAPENLALLTPGDVIFLAHDRDPVMSARNRRNRSKATAKANVERAAARRA